MKSLVMVKTNLAELLAEQNDAIHPLIEYIEYCRNLGYQDTPSYSYLARLISQIAGPASQMTIPSPFTWTLRATTLLAFPNLFNLLYPQKQNDDSS